jgi:hypothetical protein
MNLHANRDCGLHSDIGAVIETKLFLGISEGKRRHKNYYFLFGTMSVNDELRSVWKEPLIIYFSHDYNFCFEGLPNSRSPLSGWPVSGPQIQLSLCRI